jgi:hypothetical protein
MATEINPILWKWHVSAAGRGVMNLVVAVALLIAVKNEVGHFPSPTVG